MPILFRKIVRIGPLHLNFSKNGMSSWSLKFGRWSWNSKTRTQRIDLPGPVSWRGKTRNSN